MYFVEIIGQLCGYKNSQYLHTLNICGPISGPMEGNIYYIHSPLGMYIYYIHSPLGMYIYSAIRCVLGIEGVGTVG